MTGPHAPTNTLCVILARGGSKGIPNKNIAPLLSRPLIHFAITAALASISVNSIVVSSDSPEILSVAERYDDVDTVRRSSELSSDSAASLPAIRDALVQIEESTGENFDNILLLQCVAPMVIPDDIDKVLAVLESTDSDSAVTVVNVGDLHPAKLKVLEEDIISPYLEEETQFTRQFLPDVYIRNSSCYALSRRTVLAGSLYGESTAGHVVPRERFINIDEPVDLAVAEAMMKWLANRSTDPYVQAWVQD